LAADLKAAGVNAWLDTRDIAPGHEWDRAIEAALAKIPCMILILSPSSAASRNVRDEISFAIDSGKEIFPVLYRACELPLQVRRLQYVDFRDDYEAGRAALIAKLTGVSAPTRESSVPARRRWPLFAAALSLLSIAVLFWVLRPQPVVRQSASLPESMEAKSSSTAPSTPVIENHTTPPNIAQIEAAARSQRSKASPSKAASNSESRPEEAGLRLEIQNMKQATPNLAPDQPRWNGEPVWCDTAVFDLLVAHNRTVPDPLLVNDLGIRTERVAARLPDSVDCSIDTLNSKPFGIVVVNQYSFDLSAAGLSGRFIKSGRMGDASPVNPDSLLQVGGEKLAITLQPNETATPFNISVHTRAPGLYRVWFTAGYDESGPHRAKSQSFLLAK
jgi:hypothetical protein